MLPALASVVLLRVALATRLPSRCSRPGLPADIASTCRISEAFVRLGPMEVRFLTVYGYQAAMLDAKEHNESLLRAALTRATQNAMPCIVAGDFNMCPLDLPSGQSFVQLGYQEVFQFHFKRTGTELPPTCKNSTRHDTALLHPSLLHLWASVFPLGPARTSALPPCVAAAPVMVGPGRAKEPA